MTTIITRAGKGSPLTNAELDANFNNLNNNKIEVGTGTTAQVIHNPLTYTPSRTLLDKLNERVSIKDFGGVGDGTTDNTTAFASACTWMETNSKPVYIPPGVYKTGNFTLDLNTDLTYGGFYGDDPRTTIIQDKTTTAGALFTISSAAGTIYQGQLHFENITFKANGATASSACVRAYDLAWTTFNNCFFQGGDVTFDCLGGVNISFTDCGFQYGNYGLKIGKYTRAGGGWPNNIKVRGGIVGNNALWGIYFNDGRQLLIDGAQIEGNGTTLAAVQGGLYVGSGVGDETAVAGSNASLGVIVKSCWFEANKGSADVYCLDGFNTISDSLFYSINTQVSYNVYIGGGKYTVTSCDAHWNTFTYNLYELSSAAVFSGNLIINSEFNTVLWDNQKTQIVNSTGIFSKAITSSGAISAASTLSAGSSLSVATSATIGTNLTLSSASGALTLRGTPVARTYNSLNGTDVTKAIHMIGAGVGASPETIAFNKTMANTGTVITCQASGTPATNTTYCPVITAVTTTGFTVRKDIITAGTVTQGTYTVYWTALGMEA